MKVVVQRVSQASVSIDKRVRGAIGKGFLILFGAAKDDTDEDLEYIVKKVNLNYIIILLIHFLLSHFYLY